MSPAPALVYVMCSLLLGSHEQTWAMRNRYTKLWRYTRMTSRRMQAFMLFQADKAYRLCTNASYPAPYVSQICLSALQAMFSK